MGMSGVRRATLDAVIAETGRDGAVHGLGSMYHLWSEGIKF